MTEVPNNRPGIKVCNRCGRTLNMTKFTITKSPFFEDNYLPTCNDCLTGYLKKREFNWDAINKLCQWADIPFIVKEWERLKEINSDDTIWGNYSKVFQHQCYQDLGWDSYYKQYKALKENGLMEEELPLLRDKKINELHRKWGSNYSEEDLYYLEDLYKSLLITQNVNGGLQIDQAQKLCKLSLEIDSRIRGGDKDVDKFLSSYDKLIKAADFTPKNARNAADFDSFAELAKWLEKKGKINKFYDDVTRDVLDETLKNIENFNQRLYINEGGIGEQIEDRLKSLENANKLENEINHYGLSQETNLDEYDAAAYIIDGEQDEFEIEEGKII